MTLPALPVPGLARRALGALGALGLLPPDTAGLFLGLADDLFGAWPRHDDPALEATGPAARRARLAA